MRGAYGLLLPAPSFGWSRRALLRLALGVGARQDTRAEGAEIGAPVPPMLTSAGRCVKRWDPMSSNAQEPAPRGARLQHWLLKIIKYRLRFRAKEAMTTVKTSAWNSVLENRHHDNTRCTEGNNIEARNRREGTGGKPKCDHCARLDAAGQ